MKLNNIEQWRAWAKNFPARAGKDAAYVSPFKVVNKGSESEEAEILIYDEIGRDFWSGEGMAAKDFSEKLAEIDPKAKLVVGINSPGGSVDDGLSIYNALKRRGNVVTRNDGMAASIASVILQAGEQRTASPASMVMIHKAWGMFIGNADEAAAFGDALKKHDQVIAEILASRSGVSVDDTLQRMADESWYTGNEAQRAGLVDTVQEFAAASSSSNNNAAGDVRRISPIDAPAASLSQNSVKQFPDRNNAGMEKQKTKENKTMETQNTPVATPVPTAQAIDLSPVIAAINGLKDELKTRTANSLPGADPVTVRVENLGNPLVEQYNRIYDVEEKAKMAKAKYNDLRKQLFVAQNLGDLANKPFERFDHRGDSKIMNANTVDAALANTILSGEFVTTMRTYIAPWSAFTRRVELSPVSRLQTIEVPLYSSAGAKQQNATNYESGDSVLAPIAVTVAEESKSFHVSRPEANLGLALAGLVPTNAKVLAEGIHAKMTALMIVENYGATTAIGAATDFDATDLRAILALGKNYDSVRLLLDGGHLAYLLPSSRESFVFGEPGAYGFDGGIYKNNLWTSGVANIAGFVCGPDAIVNAWGMADGLPAGEAISQSTVDVNGIPFGLSVWFSRGSRAVWASFQVMHGCAVGDATQGECLVTS